MEEHNNEPREQPKPGGTQTSRKLPKPFSRTKALESERANAESGTLFIQPATTDSRSWLTTIVRSDPVDIPTPCRKPSSDKKKGNESQPRHNPKSRAKHGHQESDSKRAIAIASNVPNLQTEEEVAQWIQQRKKRWPSKIVVEAKQREQEIDKAKKSGALAKLRTVYESSSDSDLDSREESDHGGEAGENRNADSNSIREEVIAGQNERKRKRHDLDTQGDCHKHANLKTGARRGFNVAIETHSDLRSGPSKKHWLRQVQSRDIRGQLRLALQAMHHLMMKKIQHQSKS